MSKMRCLCGHTIVDQTVPLLYKAEFIADADFEGYSDRFFTFVADLVKAREQDVFLSNNFGENYPRDLDVSSIVSDDLVGLRVVYGHTMYECENCGRLWIQPDPEKNRFVSYVPEEETRGVLRGRNKKL